MPTNHVTYDVLAEFGGLRIVRDEIVEVDFQYAIDVDGAMEPWAAALKTRIVGIAWIHNRHGQLFITDGGQVIGSSRVHDAVWLQGTTIEKAIEDAFSGNRHRPMLLPEQSEVTLYGLVFRKGDPAVVGPTSPEFQ